MRLSLQRFFARWVLATLGGWVLGIAFVLLFAGLGDLLRLGDHFAVGVGMGLGVGYAQWRVGRKWFGASSEWVWASVAGMGTPFLISDLAGVRWDGAAAHWPILLHAGLGAALVGLWQRRTLLAHSARAHWWVAACIVGWTLATAMVLLLVYPGHPNTALQAWRNISVLASGGVVLGIATGGALVWILRSSEAAI